MNLGVTADELYRQVAWKVHGACQRDSRQQGRTAGSNRKRVDMALGCGRPLALSPAMKRMNRETVEDCDLSFVMTRPLLMKGPL